MHAGNTEVSELAPSPDARAQWFLLVSTGWFAVLQLLPPDLRGPWYLLFAVGSMTYCYRRTRHLAPEVRRPVNAVVLAGAASIAGNTVREVEGMATGSVDFPSLLAEPLIVLSYVLFVGAIVDIVLKRTGRRISLDPLLDATVGTIAAALLLWTLVLVPYLDVPNLPRAMVVADVAYAAVGLVLIGAAVLALVAGSTPTASNRFLAGGLVGAFLVNVVAILANGHLVDPELALVIQPVPLILGGAGLLHPSVALLTHRPDDPGRTRRLSRRRITVLALALLTPPVLMLWAAAGTEASLWLLLPPAASLALTPLVVTRLGRLVRQNEELATQEATLRTVGERLVGAETEDDVTRVITVGAEELLGDHFVDGGLLVGERAATVEPSHPAMRRLCDALAAGRVPDAGEVFSATTPDGGVVLAVPVMVQGALRAVLDLRVTGEPSDDEMAGIRALCRESTIALRAVEQVELSVRQRSEERFGALVDNSSDIVAILDRDGRLAYVSPVAERLLGTAPPLDTPLDLDALVHPDDAAAAQELLSSARRGNGDPAEVRLRHADGGYHWFEVVGMDLTEDPNIRGIAINAREITDRKAAEEQLQLSEARFKALVQHSSDLVLVVDTDGVVRYTSPASRTVVGEEPGELLGRHVTQVLRDSGVDWDTALRRQTSEDFHPQLVEVGFRNARGDWVHLEATVTDLRSEPAVGGFVLNARDVTERTSMLQRLRYQATHDDLTGLPNRVLAAEELGAMLGRNAGASTVAVVTLDVDDFKDVNDSLGHAFGDRLLQAVAERITGALHFGDVAARVGGDEFVVVLERSRGEAQVLEVADALLSSIEQPFEVDGRELNVTASAGVAFDHDRALSAEVLLRNADTAVYRAKQQGKRQAVVFEPHMHTASFDRLELRADLARAIDSEQFIAHYQPIIDLATGRITGAEALIRWAHPRRGMLSPAIFVPLAEESGLIGQLGEWIMERACRDLAEWRRDLPEIAGGMTMAVNLSAQELHAPRLVPVVTDILGRTGLPADRLVLEVTESNLLEDVEQVQEQMRKLRALGARLAIDDFGTGYSSLGYIQRYDFDVLKIDRSFVEGMERPTNRRIVNAVLDLARELGVRTVAEGIETEEQAAALTELGCTNGQGFLFSRPVPASDFRSLMLSTDPVLRA